MKLKNILKQCGLCNQSQSYQGPANVTSTWRQTVHATISVKRSSSAPTNSSGCPERKGPPGNQAYPSGHATTSLLVTILLW